MAEIVGTLVDKLTSLLDGEVEMLNGIEDDVSFFNDELSAMKAALDALDLRDTLDPLTKDWKDHVREMAYDMDDLIADFMHSLGGGADADAKAGFVQKMAQFVRTFWARRQIAGQFKELRARVVEMNNRRTRYKLDGCKPSSSHVDVDPRMPAIYKEAAGLVGIDGPREELVSRLTATENELKVLSIWGFGGLGKTTLAKQVYDQIGVPFGCKAFISVSQRPDLTSLLNRLQLQLGMNEEPSHALEDIIDQLRRHLRDHRYLIVVDDLWDCSAWRTISLAFPENGNGSVVIVTTRLDDVARFVCHGHHEYIYRMEPLGHEHSRRLFFNRVFGSEANCPSQFKEISVQILKKCGGLPLAIITIASLLASRQAKSMNEWKCIRNSLGAKFATSPTLKEMMSILNLSYMNLPLHLRPCFLYLGMYPEDREINRDDLVRQWIAEDLVDHLHGSDLEDAAKSYFNELINRSMIQPEYTNFGEVLSCRVHDMMLELILNKCAEDNFISVAYDNIDMARLCGRKYKVRRLFLNMGAAGATSGTIATSLSQVRSFARFGESEYMPPLSLFKYLRMLVFEIPWTSDTSSTFDFTFLGQLFQLRYLKVSAPSNRIELPAEMKGLIHLETLEILCGGPPSIPSDIIHLPRLSCLFLPLYVEPPKGIGNIKSLHTLSCVVEGKILPEFIKDLGELTNLRILMLQLSAFDCPDMVTSGIGDAFVSSIGKLHKLKTLVLNFRPREHCEDQIYSLVNPPLCIEELHLIGPMFKRVPQWIGDLHCLRIMSLCVDQLFTEEVHVVGKLPSLVHLSLKVAHSPEDSAAAIISVGLFPVLECLELHSRDLLHYYYDDTKCPDVITCVVFEAGAMPKLRELYLDIDPTWGGTTPVGVEHLLGLEKIHLGGRSGRTVILAAEPAFVNAAQLHPNRPSVVLDEPSDRAFWRPR